MDSSDKLIAILIICVAIGGAYKLFLTHDENIKVIASGLQECPINTGTAQQKECK